MDVKLGHSHRVLRRIFEPKRNDLTGSWRKLTNEEINDLYYSPSIVQVIESRRMRWTERLAHMGREKMF
jgi:hypothetical protein